jgi:hypothetical protein
MSPVANIGLAERRKRHRLGVAALALGVVVVVVARTLDLGAWASVAGALAFFVGFLGVFQARARTCVALAALGARNMDAGAEAIDDLAELDASKAEARRVVVRSAIATIVVTALALLLR